MISKFQISIFNTSLKTLFDQNNLYFSVEAAMCNMFVSIQNFFENIGTGHNKYRKSSFIFIKLHEL